MRYTSINTSLYTGEKSAKEWLEDFVDLGPYEDAARKIWEDGGELAAAIEQKSDALTSLIMKPGVWDSDSTLPADEIDAPEAARRILDLEPLLPLINTLLEVSGLAVVAYDGAKGFAWAGPATLVTADDQSAFGGQMSSSRLKIQISTTKYHTIDTTRPGAWVLRIWHPDAFSPWTATSVTKRARISAQASINLLKSINATSKNRSALRNIMVALTGIRGRQVTGDGHMAAPEPMHDVLRKLALEIKGNKEEASAAVSALIEATSLEEAQALRLMDGGDYSAQVKELFPLTIDSLARTYDGPVQWIKGTENSNDWSAQMADTLALETYLPARARLIAYGLAPGVWEGFNPDDQHRWGNAVAYPATRLTIAWDLQRIQPTATELIMQLLGLHGAMPNAEALEAVLYTVGFNNRIPFDDTQQYVRRIIEKTHDSQNATTPDTRLPDTTRGGRRRRDRRESILFDPLPTPDATEGEES